MAPVGMGSEVGERCEGDVGIDVMPEPTPTVRLGLLDPPGVGF